MAVEYSRVLEHLGVPFSIKGRGKKSAENFELATGKMPSLSWGDLGGINSFSHFIVAVSEEALLDVALELVCMGAENVLIEKPGGPSIESMEQHSHKLLNSKTKLFIGYNRRYYGIVTTLLQQIEEDGGITSIHFDFSERSQIVEGLIKAPGVKENWLFHNSSHVIDLVSYIAGGLELQSANKAGNITWHPKGSVFAGMGLTPRGGIFTYSSDWKSPAGWEVLVRTSQRRFLLKPLEVLTVADGAGNISVYQEQSTSEKSLKPGLMAMVEDYLSLEPSSKLLTVKEQIANLHLYHKILNGLT